MTTTQPQDPAPRTGVDASALSSHENTFPLAISHTQMNAAYDTGEAVPLAQSCSWLVRYHDAWWVVYEHGWLRVTDNATAEDLDQAATRLNEAEAVDDRDNAVHDRWLPESTSGTSPTQQPERSASCRRDRSCHGP